MHSCILIHKLQLRNDHPWQEPFRAVLPLAMFGQVNGQHLITCRAGLLCKCKGFLFAAHFSVDVEIHLVGRLADEERGDALQGNAFCFHSIFTIMISPR